MYLQCTTATIGIPSDLFYGQQNKQPPQGATCYEKTGILEIYKAVRGRH